LREKNKRHNLGFVISAESQAELLALIFGAALFVVVYRIIIWVMDAPRTADPWGPEIDELLAKDETLALCDNCLAPQEHNGWFCPECGCTVGPYSNYLPYVYLFSQGELLRSGTMKPIRKKPIILLGYLLSSFMMSLLAPVYWVFLLINYYRGPQFSQETADLSANR
jgi:hypothetical protein